MRLPRRIEQAGRGKLGARAWRAGALCGRRGEPVRLAAEVARQLWRNTPHPGRTLVLAFWGGWRHGRT